MNIEAIKTHMNCCMYLKEECLDEGLTKHCIATILESNLKKVHSYKIGDKIRYLKNNIQRILLNSENLLDFVALLFENEVVLRQVENLLSQMTEEEILKYPADNLAGILKDGSIPYKYLNIYLQYYYGMELTKAEKLCLEGALDNYFKYYKGENVLIEENRMLFCTEVMASTLLVKLKNYDECLEILIKHKDLQQVLEQILTMVNGEIQIDDDIFWQLNKNAKEIEECLEWCCSFFSPEEGNEFCRLWLKNHALLYDLKYLIKNVKKGQEYEAKQIVRGRAAYVGFFYHTYLQPEWEGPGREELLVYAVVNKKRRFLTFIKENTDIFRSLPENSVLFEQMFFKRIININAMNQKNLVKCKRMVSSRASREVLQVLSDTCRAFTFEEVEALYELPVFYAQLYSRLDIPRVDDRIRVIKEIKNANCLTKELNIEGLAEMLSIRPLSGWMQTEFVHIQDMDVVILLLQEYKKIKHLIPEVRTVGEARYLAQNADILMKETSMENVRKKILRINPEWHDLCEKLEISDDFVKKNHQGIREFIYDDGPYILLQYYKNNRDKKEELRRLVTAEVMGRFRELKYYKDDLSKELDYPITEGESSTWKKNLEIHKGDLLLREEDGLLPIMRMGEIPVYTCLSYKSGINNNCLLACHDANKKVLYLSYKGKVVLRAAIRLTKGSYKDLGQCRDEQLEFVDLCADNDIQQEENEHQERLVLFLERPYYANLPKAKEDIAIELLLELMKKKAEQMKAVLVLSKDYQDWSPQGFVSSKLYMYISRSKAGEQYLDSLYGANRVSDEGTYKVHPFLVYSGN